MNLATPELAAALSTMLDKIDATLRESGYQGEPIAMYLAGGLAVNYYCGTRFTTDVDASFSRRVALNYRDLVVDFKDAAGKDSQIYFDTSYSPTLGPMHEDYEDDAIEWTGIGNERRLVNPWTLPYQSSDVLKGMILRTSSPWQRAHTSRSISSASALRWQRAISLAR